MGIDTDWGLFDKCYPELADPGPPTEEDRNADCRKRINSAILSYGLDKVLSMLIIHIEESNSRDEEYLTKLSNSLKLTLEEYRNRYSEEE